jgi:hypothetical protein
VSQGSTANPTGMDLGGRTVGPLTDPSHGCW